MIRRNEGSDGGSVVFSDRPIGEDASGVSRRTGSDGGMVVFADQQPSNPGTSQSHQSQLPELPDSQDWVHLARILALTANGIFHAEDVTPRAAGEGAMGG